MPSTNSLLLQLRKDHPDISFAAGDAFFWSFETKTINYQEDGTDNEPLLLHELAHAQLDHSQYERDVELIKMERDAWSYAVDNLSRKYDVALPEELIEHTLDTYRDWLHARSVCPHCSAVGYQIKKSTYSCPTCDRTWSVNQARSCALRRYKKAK